MGPPKIPSHLSHKTSLVLLPPPSITEPVETLRRKHDKQFNRWPPHINLIYPFLASPTSSLKLAESSEAQGPIAGTSATQGAKKMETPGIPQDATSLGSPQLRDDVRLRIQSALQEFAPFRLVLRADPPGYFVHGKSSATVWLRPCDPQKASSGSHNPSTNAKKPIVSLSPKLQDMQAALQAEFLECNIDTRPFIPHLSIGQATGKSGAEELSKEVHHVVEDFVCGTVASGESEDQGSETESTTRRDSGKNVRSPIESFGKGLEWFVDEVFVIQRRDFNDRFKVIGSVKLGG